MKNTLTPPTQLTEHPSPTPGLPANHCLFPSIVHTYPKAALFSYSTVSQTPRRKAVPTPPDIHLLVNGFATYIRWSASPQELQHPCEWQFCICLQTFCSASHRPQLLRALLLSGRVTARSSSAPRVYLLCLQSLQLLRSLAWPFSVIPLTPST